MTFGGLGFFRAGEEAVLVPDSNQVGDQSQTVQDNANLGSNPKNQGAAFQGAGPLPQLVIPKHLTEEQVLIRLSQPR